MDRAILTFAGIGGPPDLVALDRAVSAFETAFRFSPTGMTVTLEWWRVRDNRTMLFPEGLRVSNSLVVEVPYADPETYLAWLQVTGAAMQTRTAPWGEAGPALGLRPATEYTLRT